MIDTLAHQVSLDGTVLRFTPREDELLHMLARHAGQVLTHHHLLTSVWGESHAERLEDLRDFVKRVRDKIEADPARPERLKTLPGVGYLLDAGDWSERPGGRLPSSRLPPGPLGPAPSEPLYGLFMPNPTCRIDRIGGGPLG